MDSDGKSHGKQRTIQEARRLLEIVRHIDLARLGGGMWTTS